MQADPSSRAGAGQDRECRSLFGTYTEPPGIGPLFCVQTTRVAYPDLTLEVAVTFVFVVLLFGMCYNPAECRIH